MEEREVVDVYRCLFMRDKVGEVYEGRVSGLAGSGVYVVLDEPFVDVLIRFESLGPDRYEAGDDGLSVVGRRSGDRIALGDRVTHDVVTHDGHAPRRRGEQARNATDRRRLTCAVRAEQAEHLARLGGEADAVDGDGVAELLAKRLYGYR